MIYCQPRSVILSLIIIIFIDNSFMEKPKKNKHKKYSQIDLNVNPMRRAEKLFKCSSIRETDWTLLLDIHREDI